MRDRFGGGDEVREAHPLVRCWPFLVDTDVARTVLHGRDTEHSLDDVAVTDVAKAPIRADHGRLSRGQSPAESNAKSLNQPFAKCELSLHNNLIL